MSATSVSKRRLAVSTWSLHRTLGAPEITGPDEKGIGGRLSTGALALIDLPQRLADFGIYTLEICHFHLPETGEAYLAEFRTALAEARVELFSLLIDGGDISNPDHAQRDLVWIERWIDVAATLGAKRARVSGGKSAPSDESIRLSRRGLRRLAQYARARNVRLTTENWQNLMSSPATVLRVLNGLSEDVGFCLDFGNWGGPGKYDDLARIFPQAESCHAKCHFGHDGEMDRVDFVRCLDLSKAAGFAGPYTLIYDGPDADEWNGLDREREIVETYLPS
jgi:sugar phosphate isomerase/epimerase